MRRVLFWDIDGTLLSTGRAGVFALEEAAREICGGEVDLAAMKTSGLTDGEIARAVMEDCGADTADGQVERFLEVYERHLPERLHWRQGEVLAGVEAILDHLEGRDDVINLLLTGNTAAGAKAKLTHYGLDGRFAGGTFCAGFERRDSIARRARESVAEHGADPERDELFVIGDTPHDVSCGKAIDAITVAVATGTYSSEELAASEPALVLEELPEPQRFEELVLDGASRARGRPRDI